MNVSLDHELIRKLHHEEFLNIKEIAKKLNTNAYYIRKCMDANNIEYIPTYKLYRMKFESQNVDIDSDVKFVNCNKQGGRCRYRMPLPMTELKGYCDYIGVTGHMRGCEPEQCTRYEPVRRKF